MNLTIVGARGRIVRQLLEQAVEAGQQVTAVVRNPDTLVKRVRAFSVDLANGDSPSIRPAIAGADAVLGHSIRSTSRTTARACRSAGPASGGKHTDICSES
jgi:putative NADH-flavin reductase